METFSILGRGIRGRCPQCGEGRLFEGWVNLVSECPICGLKLASREGDTWAFMYISTAFITGLFVLAMLWVLPADLALGRFLVAAAALVFFLATWPPRKGFAVAFDYWVEWRWNNDGSLSFRKKNRGRS